MELALSAQTVGSVSIALMDGARVQKKSDVDAAPDQFLKAIAETLGAWGVPLSSFTRIVVVVGPGSFTSCRVITTIANAIGFTQTIPVVGVENPDHRPLDELSIPEDASAFAVPSYDRPPNITKPHSTRMGINRVE
ncbi:hypothetical protein HY631_01565 [Candidatus Uhrbacteria bacterium]|nr:hypothetical protein [Candidatus Uhrbacteria bacterium]